MHSHPIHSLVPLDLSLLETLQDEGTLAPKGHRLECLPTGWALGSVSVAVQFYQTLCAQPAVERPATFLQRARAQDILRNSGENARTHGHRG